MTKGAAGDVDISHDGRFLVFSHTDFAHPKELFRLDLTPNGAAPSPLTRLNADMLRDFDFGESTSFTYAG